MPRSLQRLKIIIAFFVILQFGFFLPLAPVLAEEASETVAITPVAEQVEPPGGEIVVDDEIIDESVGEGNVLVETTTDLISENGQTDEVVEKEKTVVRTISYPEIMRRTDKISRGETANQNEVIADLENFIKSEKQRLDALEVPRDKKKAYLNRLKAQLKQIDNRPPSFFEKIINKFQDWFGLEDETDIGQSQSPARQDLRMPADPAEFSFARDDIRVEKINNLQAQSSPWQKIDKELRGLITIRAVEATDSYLPTLADVQPDNQEIIINSTIQNLAADLRNNPVEIYNFVRANIAYEPYYGAKKGNLGCLEEKICNDVDTASLTVSLLRAAGIPARYKKSIIVVPISKLQNLLGVETGEEGKRTVYGVLALNKVPVHVITDNPTVGGNLDEADFSQDTHFALEWVFPEVFYDYDERGGNINNILDLSSASTTEELQTLLQDEYAKQWLPLDMVFQSYNHTQNEIVADTAGFNAENFWYGFYQYQGDLSPMNKYAADLQNSTGKDINQAQYQSITIPLNKTYDILPLTLPYLLGEGVDSQGNQVLLPESWSILPDVRKQQVKIQLKKDAGDEIVLEQNFFGSEINNQELNLYYEGATEADKQVIESYGGLHATPAELVNIRPYLLGDYARYDGTQNVGLGDSLILRFEYYLKGELESTDEKFSTAGNQEGIYVVLSQVQEDPYLDTDSRILLRGNVGLAREYLKRIQVAGALLAKSLDYQYNLNFARAVVTQNRILNTINGTPTTFDFKGLTIDASAYINDWSNRGNYKNHRQDFRLLWGLESSYQEGQVFEDIAGLEGISTVSGLQYAYANPAEYTVHIIKADNESVIDTLSLSDNTKTNFHTAVQAGNTIVTPNKFITQGAFTGLFYVSLASDWTGTYAIGEQVGSNGGYSVSQYTLTDWNDVNDKYQSAYEYDNGPDKFIYKEDKERNILCSIKTETYNQIVGGNIALGWNIANYGKPCHDDTANGPYQFGNHDHSFIIATDGAYFASQSDNYNYWKSNNELKAKFSQRYPDKNITIAKLYPYWGTYTFEEKSGWWIFSSLQSLGVYNPQKNEVYKIEGGLADFYKSDKKFIDEFVPGLIGFPLTDTGYFPSQSIKLYWNEITWSDRYQDFTAGRLYAKHKLLGASYEIAAVPFVVPPGIYEKHIQQGGKAGMGFPLANPAWFSIGDKVVYQEFENGEIITYDTVNKTTSLIDQSQKVSILQNYEAEKWNEMVEGIIDSFSEANLYGLSISFFAGLSTGKIIELLMGKILLKFGKTAAVKVSVKFIPYVGWVYGGVVGGLALYYNYPLYQACNADPLSKIEDKSPAYYCGRLGANLALAAVGFTLDAMAGKLNKLAAKSVKGLSGKSKLFTKVNKDNEWQSLKKSLIGDNSDKIKSTRNQFYERIDDLTDTDIDILASNSKVSKRLLEEPLYQPTFNGFVQGGAYNGALKRRFDLKYNLESVNYSKDIAFDMQKMINKGIGKSSFYHANEIDDLLQMYKNRNFAKLVGDKKGEIIFVKKTDGTTLLHPREYDDALPHPFLSKGEDVISAGTIEPKLDANGNIVPNYIILRNKTGHFKFHKDEMGPIINELQSLGYTVELIPVSVK